ncbi:MAG: alpha/beta hydrolase, partial [Microcoleaceae cyanobacterium]
EITITPDDFQIYYEDVYISVSTQKGKSETIHGWWIPRDNPSQTLQEKSGESGVINRNLTIKSGDEQQNLAKPGGVLLYLHGNGSNISANLNHGLRFYNLGLSVFLIDYRGFGKSTGKFPTELQVYQDTEIAFNYLVQEKGIAPENIIIYGHSLGGAIGINLASKYQNIGGVIIEGSFTSLLEMTNYLRRYWIFPINMILHQRFDSISKLHLLKTPLFFIHGAADEVVPFYMSERLFAQAPEPKQLYIVPGANHNNLASVAGDDYLHRVREFLEQVWLNK